MEPENSQIPPADVPQPSVPAQPSESSSIEAESSAVNPTKPVRVLIIEDEQFISELYIRALSKAGYDVKVIVDGAQALVEAQTNAYDVILLDIMLPNMTGNEILAHLRDPAETPNLKAKLIITTNLEMGEEDRAAIESHADGYIVKAEVTPKEMVTFLNQLQLNPS